jgi:hypothetical protein
MLISTRLPCCNRCVRMASISRCKSALSRGTSANLLSRSLATLATAFLSRIRAVATSPVTVVLSAARSSLSRSSNIASNIRLKFSARRGGDGRGMRRHEVVDVKGKTEAVDVSKMWNRCRDVSCTTCKSSEHTVGECRDRQ